MASIFSIFTAIGQGFASIVWDLVCIVEVDECRECEKVIDRDGFFVKTFIFYNYHMKRFELKLTSWGRIHGKKRRKKRENYSNFSSLLQPYRPNFWDRSTNRIPFCRNLYPLQLSAEISWTKTHSVRENPEKNVGMRRKRENCSNFSSSLQLYLSLIHISEPTRPY